MEFSNEFLIATALAVPLAISANLVTPFFQRRLDSRSKKSALRRRRQDIADFTRIQAYVENPELYFSSLIEAGLKATLYSAVVSILAGAVFALSQGFRLVERAYQPKSYDDWLATLYELAPTAFSTLAIVLGMIGSLLIIGIVRPALRDALRFKNFEQYKESFRENKL